MSASFHDFFTSGNSRCRPGKKQTDGNRSSLSVLVVTRNPLTPDRRTLGNWSEGARLQPTGN